MRVKGTDAKGDPRKGAFSEYFKNGELFCEGRLKDRKQTGAWKPYDPLGERTKAQPHK